MPSGWSSLGGQCTSPYFPGGNTYGSSAGSAVATAIGLAAAALGTDSSGFISESIKIKADEFAAGSIIGPASFTNIVGVRPTLGLTSQDGVVPIS